MLSTRRCKWIQAPGSLTVSYWSKTLCSKPFPRKPFGYSVLWLPYYGFISEDPLHHTASNDALETTCHPRQERESVLMIWWLASAHRGERMNPCSPQSPGPGPQGFVTSWEKLSPLRQELRWKFCCMAYYCPLACVLIQQLWT